VLLVICTDGLNGLKTNGDKIKKNQQRQKIVTDEADLVSAIPFA
jgi:hypothetical protein